MIRGSFKTRLGKLLGSPVVRVAAAGGIDALILPRGRGQAGARDRSHSGRVAIFARRMGARQWHYKLYRYINDV